MKYRSHRRTPITVPTTSMGDIAFLLTIFFMVCSNFAKESRIRFKPADAPEVEVVKETALSVMIDEEGAIFFQGRPMADAEALESNLSAMMPSRTTPESRMVLFKCDRSVDRRVFEPVLEAITKAEGIVVAVGEKPPVMK